MSLGRIMGAFHGFDPADLELVDAEIRKLLDVIDRLESLGGKDFPFKHARALSGTLDGEKFRGKVIGRRLGDLREALADEVVREV
jgi:hypothetical protein